MVVAPISGVAIIDLCLWDMWLYLKRLMGIVR